MHEDKPKKQIPIDSVGKDGKKRYEKWPIGVILN